LENEITVMGIRVKRVPTEPPKYSCEKCEDRGYVVWLDEDHIMHSKECECAAKRKSLRQLKQSGLEGLIREYTFKAYKTPTPWHEAAKEKAKRFVVDQSGSWLYIAGTPGSGKTHLCTAICGQLIARCKGVRYMVWREAIPKLKAMVNKEEYEDEIAKYISAPILYIDDFLKGTVTDADLNLAFTILNARYNDPRKRTIISSERTLAEVSKFDAAIMGRIYERSKGYIFKTPDKDWRTATA